MRRHPELLRFVICGVVSSALAALLAAGCSSKDEEDDTNKCVNVSLDCQPIVSPPTFDLLYANIFRPSCATGTGKCHGAAASKGLDMQTVDSAFDGLSKRVSPDDLGCSLVLKRIESQVSSFRMPPGNTPLSEPQRCAIRKWIANGAQR